MSMKVCIDAGHGPGNRFRHRIDPGAVAGGVRESSITLRYALGLARECRARGLDVFLTRATEDQTARLRDRVERARRAGCRALVSLHANAAADSRATGVEALYRSESGRALAKDLASAAACCSGLRNRGAKRRLDLAVLRFAAGPAVLLELGFLTNGADRAVLTDPDVRRRVCAAVASCLASALKT